MKSLDRTGSRRRPGSEKTLAKALRSVPRSFGWGRGLTLGGVVLGTLLVWGPSQADPGTIVHLVSTLSSCPARDFSTLQEAVDCAVAGDSINIDAGTLRLRDGLRRVRAGREQQHAGQGCGAMHGACRRDGALSAPARWCGCRTPWTSRWQRLHQQ